jgi:Zn-dependent peptidase ImmA (M78 family)
MIQEQRKKVLSKFANFIANEFSTQNVTQLEQIAQSESLQVYEDHYEDCFDGMLVCDQESDFHIHINLDRNNSLQSKRGRFTFSHELAHYFIDEHRVSLITGEAAPHGSLHDYEHRDAVEEEADYFAGCLLMPDNLFRKIPTDKKFSLETILKLSAAFNTSILSTVLRFAEVGTHGICAAISENNRLKWFTKSNDFPDWAFRCKVGQSLPPTTVAGEFNTKPDAKYTGVEDIDPDDWFYSKWQVKSQLHEQCYYSDSYGYVVSLIWFD